MDVKITIDGINISNLKDIDFPSVRSKKASFNYNYDPDNLGQKKIDKLFYEGGEEVGDFEIELVNGGAKWNFEAKIKKYAMVIINCIIEGQVELELCGKFEYKRGYENPVIVKRDFSEYE